MPTGHPGPLSLRPQLKCHLLGDLLDRPGWDALPSALSHGCQHRPLLSTYGDLKGALAKGLHLGLHGQNLDRRPSTAFFSQWL